MSWQSTKPKIWTEGAVAIVRRGLRLRGDRRRRLQLFVDRHGDARRAGRVGATALRAMIIRSARGDETESGAQLRVRPRLLRRVLGVVRLDAEETRPDELRDQLILAGKAGVGEHRDAAGSPRWTRRNSWNHAAPVSTK